MKNLPLAFLLAIFLATSFNIVAQDEPPEENYIYATYFYCDNSREDQADELIKKNSAPFWDAAVEDGTINGWGWLAHHTGGKWRRLRYHTAGSVDEALAALEIVGQRIDEAMGDQEDDFNSICSSHDDYIWQSEAGNSVTDNRGKAGLSVYEICSFEGEGRAAELVKDVFAPIYDKAVADGKITSWGSSTHVVGGKYRRLSTMTGNSFAEVLKTRNEIIAQIYGEDGNNPAGAEYAKICGSHSDYLWEIMHEKRK